MISLSMYKTPKIKKKNLLELISNYSKAAGYGVIIQNQQILCIPVTNNWNLKVKNTHNFYQ